MKSHCKTCGAACWVSKIAWGFVILGALNWGLVGIFNFDLVAAIFGRINWLQDTIYIIIGISGILALFGCRCRTCKGVCDVVAGSSSQPKNRCTICEDGTCRECETKLAAQAADSDSIMDKVEDMMDEAKEEAEDMMEDIKDMVDGDDEDND